MAHGKFPKDGELDPAWKDHHPKGFNEAMKEALNNWSGDPNQVVTVTFGAKVSPNPGGVKEYHVTITP
jgi:hypothetical protein